MEQYIQQYSNFLQVLKAKGNNAANLVGSWTVEIGDQDEASMLCRNKTLYFYISGAYPLIS